MPQITPYALCQIQSFNNKYIWYRNKPPVVLTTLASDLHANDSGSIDDGRYHEHLGAIHGPDRLKVQDTFLHGTAGRVGRAFTKTAGVADDNWREPVFDMWGIFCNDGKSGGFYDLLADDTTSSIETLNILIYRSAPPPSSTPTATNCYTFFELCAGNGRNFRVLMAFGKAIALQFTTTAGATWKTVAILKGTNGVEVTFTAQDYIIFYIRPNYTTGQLTIDTSTGGVLQWTPNDDFTRSNPRNLWLPAAGRIRLKGQNGWSAFLINAKRHDPAKVSRTHDIGYPHPQAASAFFSANALTGQANQNISHTLAMDGSTLTWEAQVALPDVSDFDPGSPEAPEFTDGQLILPADWTRGVPGATPKTQIVQLATEMVVIEEVLDDNERTFTLDGEVLANNDDGQYQQAAGHFALTVYSTNDGAGGVPVKLCEAIAGVGREGLLFENEHCLYDLRMRFVDRSYQMGNGKDVPIGYELQLDKWALWSAVRLLCHLAGIHDIWLTKLPDYPNIYVPPGAPGMASPYGRADSSYTGEILGNGTGDNPICVYGPNLTPWQILQQLCQDTSLPIYDSGGHLIGNSPYYMGFDSDGYFHFEPYNPQLIPPTMGFTTLNPITVQQLYPAIPWYQMSRFSVGYTVEQLHSELTGEGQDWLTNELLVDHRDQPAEIKDLLGFPVTLLARQERWGSEEYLSTVMDGMQAQCSLPVAIAGATLPHLPGVHVGQVALVLHRDLGIRPVPFYLTQTRQTLREGPVREGVLHATMRATANF